MIYVKLFSVTMFATLLVSSVIASQYANITACLFMALISSIGMLVSIYSIDKE